MALNLTEDQLGRILAAIKAPKPPSPVPQVPNPVLSTPGAIVNYEAHDYENGIRKDTAGVDAPEPFTGNKMDAEPFMNRLETYFKLKPKSYRFTWQRITYACRLMKSFDSREWAKSVEAAISKKLNNDDYFDNWTAFRSKFLEKYGLREKKQHYQRIMMDYVQGPKMDARTYLDKFNYYRTEAGLSKQDAYYYLRKNTRKDIQEAARYIRPPPRDYDSWANHLKETQQVYDDESAAKERKFTFNNSSHKASNYVLAPGQIPMDLNLLQQQIQAISQQQAKKKFPPRPQPKQNVKPSSSQRPPVKPTPKSSIPYRSTTSTSFPPRPPMSRTICFKCGEPGHFARSCSMKINSMEDYEHRIQAMSQVFEGMVSAQEEQAEEENGQNPEEEEQMTEYHDYISQVDYQEEDHTEQNEEEPLIQLDDDHTAPPGF